MVITKLAIGSEGTASLRGLAYLQETKSKGAQHTTLHTNSRENKYSITLVLVKVILNYIHWTYNIDDNPSKSFYIKIYFFLADILVFKSCMLMKNIFWIGNMKPRRRPYFRCFFFCFLFYSMLFIIFQSLGCQIILCWFFLLVLLMDVRSIYFVSFH